MILLLLIGALSGTWLLAGIIPAFIHYGMMILQPQIFLFAACVVCAVLSLATGSSWGTVGTVGIALGRHRPGARPVRRMGRGRHFQRGLLRGQNVAPQRHHHLAPAVAGTDLITHIRYMAYTTGPSIGIALVVFLCVGFAVARTTAEPIGSRVCRGGVGGVLTSTPVCSWPPWPCW